MTPHEHRTHVEGCYRCELGRDEAADALADQAEEAAQELYAAGPWGDPYALVDGGVRMVSDAHSMDVYRQMARMVLEVSA